MFIESEERLLFKILLHRQTDCCVTRNSCGVVTPHRQRLTPWENVVIGDVWSFQ